MTQQIPASEEEEYEERRRALLGLPLLGPLAGGQPPANTPMVQGTPQFSNVPVVQGNPGGPSPAPALQGAPSSTPSLFAPASAPYTPPPLPNPESWPPSYPNAPLTNPSSSPKQTGSGNADSRPGGGSCALTGLIVAVVFLVIIGTIGGLLFGVPPAFSLFGGSNKIPQSVKGQAKLNITPEALNFGTLDTGQKLTKAVTVSNSGSLALDWKVNAASANWVTLDTTSQTIQPGALPDTIHVSVDTTNLAAGNQSATLTISSNGGSAQLAITLVVNQPTPAQQPCMLSAPSSSNETFNASMGSNPAAQTLTIGASGSCSSGVTITPTVRTASGTGWLAVSPSAATLTSGSAAFTVTVTSSRLSPGSYTGTISLAAESGNSTLSGSPQTVGVTLTVTEVPPVLAVSPGTLALSLSNGDSATARSFTISNTGGAPLNWTATLDANAPPFVSLSPGAGTNLSAGANTGVKVNVNPSRVEAGNYAATVTVSATDPLTGQSVKGSPVTVSVTITITVPPSMQLSTTSLTFTPGSCVYTASGTVTITNTGGGTLSWSAGNPVYASNQPTGWLTVSPVSGSDGAGGPTKVKFSADGTGFQLGVIYTATVTITPSVGTAQTITVTFTINCLK
ncbi:MAG: BACON domain-containing protein [Ktedonobacteraceae bacterium]